MPSTDRRVRGLTLLYRRADIAAFWILTTVGTGMMIALASWAIGRGEAWLCLGAVSVLLPRVALPRWFEHGISAWNAGVTAAATFLRWYVLTLAYYTLFAAVGRTDAALDLVRHASQSRWISRSYPEGSASSAWEPWLRPFLWLLMMLPADHEESAPLRSTYTLY